MTRLVSRIVIGALVASTIALSIPAAGAAGTTTSWTGRFYPCSGTGGEVFVSADKIVHLFNSTNHNLWVTSTPLLNGFADNVVDAAINIDTGVGVVHPRESLRPSVYDGTWESNVLIPPAGSGQPPRGVGRGTGELQGMTLKFYGDGIANLAPGENPCGTLPFAAILHGEIQIP